MPCWVGASASCWNATPFAVSGSSLPEAAFEEASNHLPMLLEKRGIPRDDVLASLSELRAIVEAVEADFYRSCEQQARQRLRGRDEADWPILATALGLGCSLWTEDQDFFGTGVAVWTTDRIEILLEQESSATGSERSELSELPVTRTQLESCSNPGGQSARSRSRTTSTTLEPTIPTRDCMSPTLFSRTT